MRFKVSYFSGMFADGCSLDFYYNKGVSNPTLFKKPTVGLSLFPNAVLKLQEQIEASGNLAFARRATKWYFSQACLFTTGIEEVSLSSCGAAEQVLSLVTTTCLTSEGRGAKRRAYEEHLS